GHGARKARERGAQTEDQRIEKPDVDAERRDHRAVAGAGPDAHAQTRARHEHPQEHRHGDTDQDDDRAIRRIRKAGQDAEVAAQEPGDAGEERGATPDDRDQLIAEENQAVLQPVERLLEDEREGYRHAGPRANKRGAARPRPPIIATPRAPTTSSGTRRRKNPCGSRRRSSGSASRARRPDPARPSGGRS